MKTLIVYYSRTGITKKVAEYLQRKLNCDIEEIIDTKKRDGVLGYIIGGKDAMQKNLTTIKPLTKNITDYEQIIIGTPVWGHKITPAVRTFIAENKSKLKNIAVFCTMGSSGMEATLNETEKVCEKVACAKLSISTKDVLAGKVAEQAEKFLELLNKTN
jgi:flavodoxin